MKFFYLRHHYLSIVRSKSFNGEVFAFVMLAIFFGSIVSQADAFLEGYAVSASRFFSQQETNYSLFLMIYLLFDLSTRLVIKRPLPKLRYYMLWSDQHKSIASQYLITSLFGIIPFLLVIVLFVFASKAGEWLGITVLISTITWWFVNHFLGLASQFSDRRLKTILMSLIVAFLVLQFFIPDLNFASFLLSPIASISFLVVAILVAYHFVKGSIERREGVTQKDKKSILEALPGLSFKNPVFQLEWALIIRNKRTRSNLLLGLISVMILPFLLDEESQSTLGTLIFFIVTGFFIIQHGVYSLGWEGSYFDFLVTNISPKTFVRTRYIFYLGTCAVGLVLAAIPTIINGLDFLHLLLIFVYNIGVTIPLVLYRSTLNSTKIVLTESSFMNYNGMMTGPIFVSSFLITLLPLFIYGAGTVFLEENAIYLLAAMGLLGLVAVRPVTDLVAKKYYTRKYHLSQSFKS